MPGRKQIASHDEFVKLEALVESGLSVYEASQQLHLPLGAFKSKNGDPEWFAQIKAKEETCRAAKVDKLIDRRVESGEAGDSLTKAWAARNHADYREKQELEITAKVEHEHRGEFAIGHLIAIAKQTGVLDQLDGGLEDALPAAREISAGPARHPERAASDLPPAP